MKVILLAAGQSTRVKPIEDKNFIKFCGKYLIEHQIEAMEKAGFHEIIVIVNKFNINKFENLIAKLNESMEDISITPIVQTDLEAGMAGAILACDDLLGTREQILVTSSNDVIDDSAYKTILDRSLDSEAESLLLAYQVEGYFPGGYLKVDDNNFIQGIIEKPGEGNQPSDLVNIVCHFHKDSQKLLEYLKKTDLNRDDRYEKALDLMIQNNSKMEAVPYTGFWQPIKYPWHVFKVFEHYFKHSKKHISKQAKIADTALIKGDVIIEDNVKILENAVVNGPCYIGKDVVIANNALVRESNLEQGCVAGFSTEIARSVLGENVWTHSNYIGDSIIGDNCSFGAGTVTGNLRLDEKTISMNIKGAKTDSKANKLGLIAGNNIRVGINTSIMPGVKIGSNSMIGAGITVSQDIPENSFVRGEINLKISENKAELDENARQKMRDELGG